MPGFVKFKIDGTVKIMGVESDFEPDAMGLRLLDDLRHKGWLLGGQVRSLTMLEPDREWSDEDHRRLRRVRELSARDGAGLVHWTLAVGVAVDRWEIPSDGSTVSWGYVIDLDHRRFEVYQGGQTQPHRLGRFIDRPQVRRGFWPPRLVADWTIPDDALGLESQGHDAPLPTDDEFLAKISGGVSQGAHVR